MEISICDCLEGSRNKISIVTISETLNVSRLSSAFCIENVANFRINVGTSIGCISNEYRVTIIKIDVFRARLQTVHWVKRNEIWCNYDHGEYI